MNRARNADHAARTCEGCVCSIVKITRFSGYQTWQTFFFLEIHEVRKGLWAFYVDCAFWLLIGWAGTLRSRGDMRKRNHLQRPKILHNNFPENILRLDAHFFSFPRKTFPR